MTTITDPLAALAGLPSGIVSATDNAAIVAAGGDIRTARKVVDAVEPLIVDDVVRRILLGATETHEYTMRIHYTDGREPEDGQPMRLKLARFAVEGINQDENAEYRQREHIDRAEVVRRTVFGLRDGSTLIGPWQVAVEPAFPGGTR